MKLLRQPVCYILFTYLLFSLFTMSYYGMHWDEAPQHDMGRATLDYLTGRTPQISFQAPAAYNYGVYYHVLNRLIALILINWLGFEYVDAFHFVVPLIALVGFLYFYKLAKLVTNQKTALFALILLILNPRLLALSQYDIKDISLLSLGIIALFYLAQTFEKLKKSDSTKAGISFGLTLSVQLTAVFPILIFTPAYLITKIKSIPKHIVLWLIFAAATLATLSFTWPTLWNKPILILQNWDFFFKNFFEADVRYFGQNFNPKSLPWHYPFFYIFATTPILVLTLFLVGFVVQLFNLKKNLSLLSILSFSWFAIPLLIYQIPNIVRYDGIRHYLDIMPAIALFAGIGINFIVSKVSTILYKIILSVLAAYLIFQVAIVFPYGDAYFNEVIQTFYPQNIDEHFEIEYWGEAYREASNWLNQNATQNAIICVPVADHILQFYPRRPDIYYACAKNSNYLVFITRWTYLPKDLETYFPISKLSPVYTINRLNSDLLRIYKLDEKSQT